MDEQFREAINEHSLEKVNKLIEDGADIHVCNDYPLFCAVYVGNIEIVNRLVELAANIHVNNLLEWAYIQGHDELVKILINYGVKITDELIDKVEHKYKDIEMKNFFKEEQKKQIIISKNICKS